MQIPIQIGSLGRVQGQQMSHPEAPTLCWCFDLDILNHNMVNTSDTIMITCKYWPAENRFPP